MGDAQSAQREGKKDAAAAEESGKVEDAHTEQSAGDKPLKNNAEISEINGKTDKSIAGVNGHCEDELAAEAILSPEVQETETPCKEEDTPFENVEVNEKESPNEADANEEVPLEMIEIDAKQNDINESFRRFFSNIGLKLTVKKGSSEIPTDVPSETNKEEPDRPQDIVDDAKEPKCENAEHSTDANISQEICDNDSTTCPTLTDATSEDVLENAEEKTTETKEEIESDHANAATTSPVKQDTPQDATAEEEPSSTSPSSPEAEVVSPIKRFFTTGIFSGLRKKKKHAEDETTEKELVDMGKKEEEVTSEETVQDQQDKEVILGVEPAAVETEHKENELKEEILSSQEKDKIQASPLKRLLSGSSLKKGSKKPRGRKSSDAKLSDSGEHVSDQLLSSTESAKNLNEEGPAQPAADVQGEEDGAWASFKKLVTPKKRIKRPSLSNEETQIPGSVEEPKPSDGEQISDHSTEESKKRKDSSVSWEAVLCGSGRRRSRKTSDSEDESPQIDNNDIKQGGGSKHGPESPLESSNDNKSETLAASPKQAGSPSEGDAGSTWKSFKRLVTPKRKAKDEDESKETIQSDGEVCQDESSFSIKKLLPGRKKRKSVEKQDQLSSDEADRDIASGDEDSETPAVVPLSEFDTAETEVHIRTQADIESHIPGEADFGLQQDLQTQMAEEVLSCDSLQTETKKVQDGDISEKQESTTPTTNEEPDDLTESTTKHQQLSDIPEEGLITETPASVNEEVARDDTIADDLIEITSEAFTAPEPLDITQADETEMISAVSQLSAESSKTSGNATPVPAEYDVMETDVLLHQVVETISPSPQAVPVFSDNLSERKVSSASPQILETFEKEEHTILETQRELDATATNTGLHVTELDATNELVATSQTESISEVNDSVSTEIVSEVPTEEYDTAEIAVDEVLEVSVTHTEERIEEKELKSIDESHHPVECLSEDVSTDILPEGEEIVPDEGSLVEEHQAETEPTKTDSEETDKDDVVGDETKDEALKLEVQSLTEMENQILNNITNEIQAEDQDQPSAQIMNLQDLADVQAEVNVESEKGSDLETDKTAKTEDVQVEESLDAVQISMLDSEEGSDQSPEEGVKSEDIPQEETATDESKQTAEHLTKVSVEPENKELPLEKDEGVQSLENEVASEDVPEAETVKEVNLEPTDASEIGHVQEVPQAVQAATLDSEEDRLLSVEKEEVKEDIPTVEKITDEPKQDTEVRIEPEEELPVEAIKPVSEVLLADVTDNATEIKSEEEAGTGSIVQELERQILLEDVPKPTTSNDIASVTDEIEGEVVAELDKALESKEDQEIETEISGDVEFEKEDCIPEIVDEIQKITAVHVSSVNEEACNVQVLEKTVFIEETQAPSQDSAACTDEPKHEAQLGAVQVSVEEEKEKELPGTEIRTARVEHAIVAQVVTCNLKEVTASIPDIFMEKTSDIIEPLIDTVTNKLVIKEEVEVAMPIVKDNMAQTAEEGNVVMVVHAPSVGLGDNHQIQVQVVDVDIKSAETIVDSVLELGVTEHKEVIDVCLETVKKVDNLSATAETEGQFINEENEVTIQEVIQHVKENVPETIPKSVDVNLEQVNQPDTVTGVSEMVQSELKELEDQEAVQESIQTTKERQDEASGVISEDSATEQQVSMPTPDTLGSPDVCIHDHKEDLEETKAELEKSETAVTAEEFKSSSELVVKKSHEQVPITQVAPSPLVQPSNTGLVVPQNTGIISSIGNVESPSSLSLEFKLNIQFGQTKAPAYPSPTTERSEPVKQTEVSDVGVQAVEELVKTERSENQKQTEETEVPVQATDISKPVRNVDSPERAVVATPPALLEVGLQGMETVETAEQIKPTEKVTSSAQTTETTQTVTQREEREMSLCQPPTEVPAETTQISKAATNLDSTERPVVATPPGLLDVGIQAMETVETAEQIKPAEKVTSSVQTTETIQIVRQTEEIEVSLSQLPTEVLAEATQIAKATTNVDSTERAVIATQPVLQNAGKQAMETVEPAEQISPTASVTSSVQATETMQTERPTEKREVFLSQPVLSEALNQDTKAEESIKQTEEENDQDVWMDAEEVIYTQEETEVFLLEVEKPLEPQKESEKAEIAGLKHEVEMVSNSKTEEEESQQEEQKVGGTCEIDSEGEDFAVALEHPDTAAANATTMEWD